MAKTADERRADKAEYMRRKRAEDPEKYRAKSKEFNARHRERLNAERNAKYAENKADVQAKRHGTPKELLDAVLALQGGACAICEKPLTPWPSTATHIDHCHDSGEVRGLLCRSCNMKEGWVKKHKARLFAYLDQPPAKKLLGLA